MAELLHEHALRFSTCQIYALTVWCCWVLTGENILNIQLPSQLNNVNHREKVPGVIPDNGCEPILTMKVPYQPEMV